MNAFGLSDTMTVLIMSLTLFSGNGMTWYGSAPSPDADLDKIFRPLENGRTSEMLLGKEKARLRNTPRHASWLRIYAIKLEPGVYVITGGAIKLTRTMQEREHTLVELARMEKVRRFLLDNDIADKDSFVDYQNELK